MRELRQERMRFFIFLMIVFAMIFWIGIINLKREIATFGIGNMVQSNSVSQVMASTFNVPLSITGLILMIGVASVIIGGIKSIGKVVSVLVPLMIFIYFTSRIA